ncbi:MAG TPA: hypothetical protein VK213_05395 [Bacteroidales bacterium]|nr:hypothetical protein [Bacteroidales bacterium]
MIFYVSPSSDPFFNLALEELLIKNYDADYIIISINKESVITGKHQCAHRETETSYVTGNKIPVIRRISGGGTVYHDQGNLNLTFIHNSEAGKQVDFARYLKPVLSFLSAAGINAVQEGSDIRVNGLKISGNAEHVFHNRVLHHGTILFDACLETLRNCLRKDTSSYVTRAVVSNPANVINLKDLTSRYSSIQELQYDLAGFLMNYHNDSSCNEMPEQLIREAQSLAISKYSTWEWNYAYGPEYEVQKNSNIFEKKSKMILSVKDGIILSIVVKDNPGLERKLRILEGCRHMPGEIQNRLNDSGLFEIDAYGFF